MKGRYGLKEGRKVHTFPTSGGLTLRNALRVARNWTRCKLAKRVSVVRLWGKRSVVCVVTPPPPPPYKHESWWTIRCHQSSCGTSAVWYNTHPKSLKTDSTGFFGGPTLPDPGFGAVVKVTFEVLKPGKAYPVNPYAPRQPRRLPSRKVKG